MKLRRPSSLIAPNIPLFAVATSMVIGILAGCSATTPAFNTPQLTPPPLAPRENSRSNKGAIAARKSAESRLPALESVATPKGLFAVEPYLQWGKGGTARGESIEVCWQANEEPVDPAKTEPWVIETRSGEAGTWQKIASAPSTTPLSIPGDSPATLYSVTIDGLTAGALFDYRVSKGAKPVFIGRARARKSASESQRFVVFGDCAEGTPGQKRIAFQTSKVNPDFVFITGDIVYPRGRASEYLEKFFPIYNAAKADPGAGAPLLRSVPILASIGNHDGDYSNFDKWPDALAYFYYFRLPMNGPELKSGGPNAPKTSGSDNAEKAMLLASGNQFPRTANYSFDYGNAHWTVLDSNYYTNWSSKELQTWLENDLASAQKATWRFVAFHIPPFHTSREHGDDQWMRMLCPLFEKYKVDVVWNGHVHNYQRSYPLTFMPDGGPDEKGRVEGKWTLDKDFDGDKNTRPNGPIYIVTGGGGAALYDPDIQQKPADWKPFIHKYVANTHSFTQVDIDGGKMSVRQVSEKGAELDKFVITK